MATVLSSLSDVDRGEEKNKTIQLGMIGLDTSHVIAFTKYLNDPKDNRS
jgi:hypothetical protein